MPFRFRRSDHHWLTGWDLTIQARGSTSLCSPSPRLCWWSTWQCWLLTSAERSDALSVPPQHPHRAGPPAADVGADAQVIRRGQKEAHQHGTPASIFKILLAKEKAQRIAADVKSKPPARLSS